MPPKKQPVTSSDWDLDKFSEGLERSAERRRNRLEEIGAALRRDRIILREQYDKDAPSTVSGLWVLSADKTAIEFWVLYSTGAAAQTHPNLVLEIADTQALLLLAEPHL